MCAVLCLSNILEFLTSCFLFLLYLFLPMMLLCHMSQFILVNTFIIKLYNTTNSTCLSLLCPPRTWRTFSRFPELECSLRCIQRRLHPLRISVSYQRGEPTAALNDLHSRPVNACHFRSPDNRRDLFRGFGQIPRHARGLCGLLGECSRSA